jgi:TolB protein
MGDQINNNANEQRSQISLRVWVFRLFLLLTLMAIAVLGWIGVRIQEIAKPTPFDPEFVALATSLSFTATPSMTLTLAPPTATFTSAPTRTDVHGTLVFSSRVKGRSHLFAYVPGDPSPIQLNGGDWDDRDPEVSPDGTQVAFSSNRNGAWDLYLYEFKTGKLRQVTDTSYYEGHPTWSPDGLWLAYEANSGGDFNIFILPVDLRQDPFQLTIHPAADTSPNWDPNGRRIAFISHREGFPDVFIADLDQPDDRFRNLTNSPYTIERNPIFSPDGANLAYSASSDGVDLIMRYELDGQGKVPAVIGQGREIAWSPNSLFFVSILQSPVDSFLQAYALATADMTQPIIQPIHGVLSVDWTPVGLPGEAYVAANSRPTDSPLLNRSESPAVLEAGRYSLIDLPGISAPHPSLSDAVDEVFLALRGRTAELVGWDFLGSLENAFVGLNDPLPPGFTFSDWLYTGRAFAFNQAAVQAGWVEFVREDFGGQTYWRVFVRTSVQDGSLGEPLRVRSWQFDTRRNGDPQTYDRGGSLRDTIPQGYYVDFTLVAADFGFERVPSLPNWRTFYYASRFNEFVLTDGLGWTEAMLQLYPASAIVTPTPYRTPTLTPTRTPRPTATPWWLRWRTSTPTRTQAPLITPTSAP